MTRLRIIQPSGHEWTLPVAVGTRHVGSAILGYRSCPPVQCLLGPEFRKVNRFVLEEHRPLLGPPEGSWVKVAEWNYPEKSNA